MSFLTPLYLLGALAVSLPILFHMIRRTPRDRQEFSSVMFLQPSPPKITRRSRIEHWLLLFLRALAVCLLALAFARPFLRQSEQGALDEADGRSTIVLLDTSASMRRDGLWDEATAKLDEYLHDEVGPADRVAVLTFDDDERTLCSFEQWASLEPGQRGEAVTSSLADVSPGWRATDLASALIEATERLDALTTDKTVTERRTVVVISDLQSGSRLGTLQSYDWPKGIAVELRPVGVDASPNNAGIQLVGDSSLATTNEHQKTRVRITNAEGADLDGFTIRWTDEFDEPAHATESSAAPDTKGVSVIVPSGQSRVVRAADRPEGPGMGRLVLEGDDHDFDNICYVPPSRPRSAVVAMIGGQSRDDPQGMPFYIPAAFPSLPQREITLVDWDGLSEAEGTPQRPQLVIATGAPPEDSIESLRTYLTGGGTLLLAAATASDLTSVYTLIGVPPAAVSEADVDEYAMLTRIDFGNPLFAPLADARFSNFTKVHIWKHRAVPADSLPEARVLAWFDDGDPAVVESRVGQGRIIIFAFGWNPDDSQLATSTKFVPMLNGLVDDVAGIVERRTTYLVGEPVPLAEFDLTGAEIEAVRTPMGGRVPVAAEATSWTATDTPGVYTFLLRDAAATPEEPPSFTVNLDPAESRTARMTDDVLLSAGVRLTADATDTIVDAAAERQLRAAELENRQKLWRWLVVAVIAILLAETLLASRAARRQLAAP